MREVPIVSHDDHDQTLSQIMDHIITTAYAAVEGQNEKADQGLLERAVEVVDQGKEKGHAERETVA
ncbi:MAG: hypothetical protein M3174_01610, partial [Actinomycetota bacterium]|nr:hypothetical protein [Actinomycetota bacterium]